jgi:hypothetical protein
MKGTLGGARGIARRKQRADEATQHDCADLSRGGRRGKRQHRGGDRECRARPIGRECARHAPHRERYHGNRDDLQSVEPRRAGNAAECAHAVAHENEGRGRRRGESEPRAQRAGNTGAQQTQRDSRLAARRTRQKLTQRDDIGVRRFVDPAPPRHELGAEIAQMRHRPAKGGAAELQESAQHFERRSSFVSLGGGWRGHDCPFARGSTLAAREAVTSPRSAR